MAEGSGRKIVALVAPGFAGARETGCRTLEAGRRLLREDSGQDLIEYALVMVFIAMAAIASMQTLATQIGVVFAGVGTVLSSAV